MRPDTLEGERQPAHLQYTYGLPRSRFRPYAVIAMGSDASRVGARPWPGGQKRRGGWSVHPVAWGGDGVVVPLGRATGLSLSARRMAVLSTFGKPVLRRYMHCEFMRSALLDMPPIMPTTACHQRNCVERYRRSIGTLSHPTRFVRAPSGSFFTNGYRTPTYA